MVKITKTSEIDHQKLDDLFRQRGHGILADDFILNINRALEDSNSDLEVHQCDCGELYCIQKTEAAKLRLIQKTENISCRKCLGIVKGKFSFVIIKKIEAIQKILKINKSDPCNPSVLAEIREIGKGIIPTGNMDEVFVGINDLKRKIKNEPYQILGTSSTQYPIIDEIFTDAIKKDPLVAEKLLKIADLGAQNIASDNCNLRYNTINKVFDENEKLKFFGIPHQSYFPQNSEEEKTKIDITQKMTLYKDLFELGKYWLCRIPQRA